MTRHFDATIMSLRYVTVKLRLILLKDFEYVSVNKATMVFFSVLDESIRFRPRITKKKHVFFFCLTSALNFCRFSKKTFNFGTYKKHLEKKHVYFKK